MNFPFINPVDILQQRAAEDPQRLSHMLLGANESENQSLTYSQLDKAVKLMAAYLQGVAEPGQRALLVYPTSLEFIIAMYACLYAGIVPIPTNPPGANRSAQRLDAIARDARASLVLTTPDFQSAFISSADQYPDFAALRWVTRDSLRASPERVWQPIHPRPEDIAFMQYTSGSTNIPKGVIISHRNFSHQMHALHASRSLEYSRDDSAILSWTPLFHDMGLLVGIFLTVVDHTPGIMMAPIAFMQQPVSWLKAIQKYHVTASGGPNFAYELCANKIPVEK
ncbi:MAG: AMP-binding protein, partial [Anaerolineales bacterium]|nr:AMP-binding protein [Anaerolineales bacterium]